MIDGVVTSVSVRDETLTIRTVCTSLNIAGADFNHVGPATELFVGSNTAMTTTDSQKKIRFLSRPDTEHPQNYLSAVEDSISEQTGQTHKLEVIGPSISNNVISK